MKLWPQYLLSINSQGSCLSPPDFRSTQGKAENTDSQWVCDCRGRENLYSRLALSLEESSCVPRACCGLVRILLSLVKCSPYRLVKVSVGRIVNDQSILLEDAGIMNLVPRGIYKSWKLLEGQGLADPCSTIVERRGSSQEK